MGDIIASTAKLPAHLAKISAGVDDEWSSGQATGFPVISTKGKVFRIRRGEEVELVTRPDDPDEPASSLQLVILKTHPGVAKTYFKGTYEEGSDDKPTCYSNDGIAPAEDAEHRQAKKCAICKQNQWGSRITESGKKAKKCSDVKRLAVAPVGLLNDPMLLRVPPTSLKAWDQYTAMLRKRGLTPAHVVTKISFDPQVAHQLLIFKPVDFVTAEMVPAIEEALADNAIEAIIGGEMGHAPVEELVEGADEDDTPPPPPKKKPAAKKKPAPKEEPDEEDDFDIEGEDEEDTPPPPAPKKKPAAKKRKPEPDPEPEASDEDDGDEEDDDFDDLDFDDLDFDD